MPKWRPVRAREEVIPRAPGTVSGGVSKEAGGVLEATCGVCGAKVKVPVPPGRVRPVIAIERALRRAGWRFLPPLDWVEKACHKKYRSGVAAGHVQLPLF